MSTKGNYARPDTHTGSTKGQLLLRFCLVLRVMIELPPRFWGFVFVSFRCSCFLVPASLCLSVMIELALRFCCCFSCCFGYFVCLLFLCCCCCCTGHNRIATKIMLCPTGELATTTNLMGSTGQSPLKVCCVLQVSYH